MINKLLFNNLLITNKANIQRARAQTIQKLVRKLRKLNVQKSENASKNQTKQRRITICMEHLKKLKRLEIMQMVLLFEKKPATVLSNEQTMPEEMATAMLAMNKIMQNLVLRFKQELKLNDSPTAKWRDEILAASRKQEKVGRTEQKRQKRKELKEQKAMERNRLEWMQSNQSLHANAENPSNAIELGEWKEEELTESNLAIPMKTKTKEITMKVKIEKPTKERVKKNNTTIDHKPLIKPLDDEVIVDVIKPKREPKPEITHEVDPFFFTETGENYLSTAVSLNKDKEHEDADEESYGRKVNMRSIEPRGYQRTKNPLVNVTTVPTSHASKGNVIEDLKDLHPSWAAKQKMKPIITEFQGKKTTFDIDDED